MESTTLARTGVISNLRALQAVISREWTIFMRYPSWIISLFIWPLIFPMAYLLTARAFSGPDNTGLLQFQAATGQSEYIGFIAIGTMIWMWQNVVLWNVGFALRNEQHRGTLESNWMAPTWRFAFLLGSSVPQLVSMLLMLGVSTLEYTLFFGVRFEGSLWLSLLVILFAIPPIYGLGFTFASLVITAREANAFVFLVRGVVMIFCGITYPIAVLPGWMQAIAAWLPQTYIIRAFRTAALSASSFDAIAPDLLMLALFGAFWLCLGYTIFKWMERRARQTGAIGQY
ncbi:MAG TPA: ABC transporter permease [Anaerolineaceae bacterium]|nr:ABC transporter permease [Anaerolineaceae bacterium]HPN53474.1 ABC transporter permease [Anaerolineaceae bacterium]